MSQPLRQSLSDNISSLSELEHSVAASGLDFGFEQEQLSYQIEALISELEVSIDNAIKLLED